MRFNLKTSAFAAVGFALLSGAGVVYAASPIQAFGPLVSGDKTLNASLGDLAQVVAWQNSPNGDIYQLALAIPVPEAPFDDVAMETGSVDQLGGSPVVHNDRSLNASLGALAQVIAWQKSPEGDAFQYALEDHVKGADFKTIALASIPPGGFQISRN